MFFVLSVFFGLFLGSVFGENISVTGSNAPLFRTKNVLLNFSVTGNATCTLNVTGQDIAGHNFTNVTNYSVVNSSVTWTHLLNSGNYGYLFNCSSQSNSSIINETSGNFTVNLPANVHDYSLTGIVGFPLALNFENNSIFNVTDPENNSLTFLKNSSSINLTLSNSTVTFLPKSVGDFSSKFDVTETFAIYNGSSENETQQITVAFKSIHGFDFSIAGSTNLVLLSNESKLNATFSIHPTSLNKVYGNYSCNVTSSDSGISTSSFNATDDAVTNFVIEAGVGDHSFTVTCAPKSNPLDVVSKNYSFKVVKESFGLVYDNRLNYSVEVSDFGTKMTKEISFKNNGTEPLTVNLVSHLNSHIALDSCFSSRKCSFTLNPGESRSVSFTLNLKYYYFKAGAVSLGTLDVDYWSNDGSYNKTGSVDFEVDSESALQPGMITITSSKTTRKCLDMTDCVSNDYSPDNMVWDLSDDYDIQAVPGDTLHFKVYVKNMFTDDEESESSDSLSLDDVTLELKINDFDIDNETDFGTIRAAHYNSELNLLEFDVKLPYRLSDGSHNFEIDVSGDLDQYYTTQKFSIFGSIDVRKNLNDVLVQSVSLYPNSLKCNYLTYFLSRIINVGRNEQDLTVDVFGNNFNFSQTTTCNLDTYSYSGDDECNINVPVNLPTKPGTYTVGMKVLRNGALIKGPYYTTVTVGSCGTEQQNKTVEENKGNETQTIVISNENATNVYLQPETTQMTPEEIVMWVVLVVLVIVVVVMIWVLIRTLM